MRSLNPVTMSNSNPLLNDDIFAAQYSRLVSLMPLGRCDIQRIANRPDEALVVPSQEIARELLQSRGRLFSVAGEAVSRRHLLSMPSQEKEKVHAHGAQLYRAGQVAEAFSLFHYLIAEEPGYLPPYYAIGILFAKYRHLNLSETYFRWVAAQDPFFRDLSERFLNLAAGYHQVQDDSSVLRVLKEACRLSPWNTDLRMRLGVAYCQQGLYEKAETAWLRCLELDEEDGQHTGRIHRLLCHLYKSRLPHPGRYRYHQFQLSRAPKEKLALETNQKKPLLVGNRPPVEVYPGPQKSQKNS